MGNQVFSSSLAFRIGMIVVLVQLVCVLFAGVFVYDQINLKTGEYLEERVKTPGFLFEQGLLDERIVETPEYLTQLTSADVKTGIILDSEGQILYRSHSELSESTHIRAQSLLRLLNEESSSKHLYFMFDTENDPVNSISMACFNPESGPKRYLYLELELNELVTARGFILRILFFSGFVLIFIGTVIQTVMLNRLTKNPIGKVNMLLHSMVDGTKAHEILTTPATREFRELLENSKRVVSLVKNREDQLIKLNEDLKQYQERTDALMNSTKDWIWETDANLNFTFSNPVGHQILNSTSSGIQEKSYFSNLVVEDRERVQELVEALAVRKKPLEYFARSITTGDGAILELESNATVILDQQGNFAGYRGIDRDVTERNRFQEKLQYQSNYEKMMSQISARLLVSQFNDLDGSIETTLDDLQMFIQCDRVCYYEVNQPRQTVSLKFMKFDREQEGLEPCNSAIAFSQIPETIKAFTNGEQYEYSSLEILKDIAPVDSEYYGSIEIESALLAPVLNNDTLLGFIGFGYNHHRHKWKKEERAIQRLTVRVMASAFSHKQAQETAKSNESKFRRLYEEALVGMVRSRVTDGEILEVNKAGAMLLGKKSKEELFQDKLLVSSLYPPERRLSLLRLLEKHGTVHNFEIQMTIAPGRVIDVDLSAKLYPKEGYIESVLIDITDRKQAEADLVRLRRYLANIVNSLPSLIIGVSQNGVVTHWNQRAKEFTGISMDDAKGKHVSFLLPGIADLAVLIDEAIESGEQTLKNLTYDFDDEIKYLEVVVQPLIAVGEIGAVVRIDDITERRRMESIMVQSEKMISVGGLAAGMAHEINNPLAGIIQSIQVLQNRLFHRSRKNIQLAQEIGLNLELLHRYLIERSVDRMVSSIMDAGTRASRIVANMLSFSRKSDRSFVECDIQQILEQGLELAGNEYSLKKQYDFRKIDIDMICQDDLPRIYCDPGQIQQVILNILKNGAQAMSEVSHRKSVFKIELFSDDNWVCISIQDNGEGIRESIRTRIFEPFFTTKPVGVGTGLGLSVSYFIVVETHSGELECISTFGKGSCFIIRLPRKLRDYE